MDRSRTLTTEAIRRYPGSEFLVADANGLPFDDDTFDAVRMDRALQHVADPSRVVAEMARVARPGGVVLCAEPDWGTFLIGGRCGPVPNRVAHDLIRRFRNPWIGRELMEHLAAAGVTDRHQEGVWLETRGLAHTELLFEIEANMQRLRSELPEADEWPRVQDQGRIVRPEGPRHSRDKANVPELDVSDHLPCRTCSHQKPDVSKLLVQHMIQRGINWRYNLEPQAL